MLHCKGNPGSVGWQMCSSQCGGDSRKALVCSAWCTPLCLNIFLLLYGTDQELNKNCFTVPYHCHPPSKRQSYSNCCGPQDKKTQKNPPHSAPTFLFPSLVKISKLKNNTENILPPTPMRHAAQVFLLFMKPELAQFTYFNIISNK